MNYKNILIAPDSFKGSISAADISDILIKELQSSLPAVNIEVQPLADGGEGTLDVLVTSLNGEYRTVEVHDPLFRKIEAKYGIIGDTAIIEMAEASGIALLESDELDPMKTTTCGTGELIKDAIDNGIRKIFVGLGGSATNDLGTGAASVFGYKFLAKDGRPLKGSGGNLLDVVELITDDVDKRIFDVSFLGLCDVQNFLYGSFGATYTYGKQKGAKEGDLEILEKGIKNINHLARIFLKKDVYMMPGSGAAGGLGGGLALFFNASLLDGFETIAQMVRLEEKIKESHLVISGEGKIDQQTLYGKTVKGLSDICSKYDKDLIVVCGRSELEPDDLEKMKIKKVFELIKICGSEEECIRNVKNKLKDLSKDISCWIKDNN